MGGRNCTKRTSCRWYRRGMPNLVSFRTKLWVVIKIESVAIAAIFKFEPTYNSATKRAFHIYYKLRIESNDTNDEFFIPGHTFKSNLNAEYSIRNVNLHEHANCDVTGFANDFIYLQETQRSQYLESELHNWNNRYLLSFRVQVILMNFTQQFKVRNIIEAIGNSKQVDERCTCRKSDYFF